MPWHYYLTQGLPLLLTFYTPFAIQEISSIFEKVGDVLIHNSEVRQAQLNKKKSDDAPAPKLVKRLSPSLASRLQLSVTSVFTILAYSLISHKEVRFIYPLLPILIILTASCLHNTTRISASTRRKIVIGLLVCNIPVAWYSTRMHQRGVIDVVNWLRRDQANWTSVGFLMPCHSTPWTTSIQPNSPGKTMWALTCEPPLHVTPTERTTYLDEADQFYLSPIDFLRRNFPTPPRKGGNPKKRMLEQTKYQWPDRLVFFAALEQAVLKEYLGVGNKEVGKEDSRYAPCRRFWNSHFHDDKRRQGSVVVYCLEGKSDEEKAWVTS